jgi:hypothetical protein
LDCSKTQSLALVKQQMWFIQSIVRVINAISQLHKLQTFVEFVMPKLVIHSFVSLSLYVSK